MTSAVSRIGTASTSSGRISVATVVSATFQLVSRPSAASANPITWLPESPMKTAAGLRGRKLNGRKPATASASESETTSSRSSEWIVTASIAKNAAAITASVAASPSMLSSRLKAFVMPTSQSRPIAVARTPFETISTRSPAASTIAAAPICARAWRAAAASAGRRRAPTTKTIAQPPRMPAQLPRRVDRAREQAGARRRRRGRRRCRCRRTTASRCSCQRSPDGAATNRRPTGVRSSAQIVSAATGSATSGGERAHRAKRVTSGC